MLPSALKAIAATLVGYLEIWYNLFLCSPSQMLTTPSQPTQHGHFFLSSLRYQIKLVDCMEIVACLESLLQMPGCHYHAKPINLCHGPCALVPGSRFNELHIKRHRKVQLPVRQGMVISNHIRAQASHCLPVLCTPLCKCHFTLAQDYAHLQLQKCQSQGGMQWH